MKVLIITYYWPPAGGSGVQRWLKFVKYFKEFGIQPVVYCPKNASYPILDSSLMDEIPENVEVIRHKIFEPNHFLSSSKKQESGGFLKSNPSLLNRFLQYVRANYFIPDARKYWVNPSVQFLEKYVEKNKIDAIITTGPPHSVHLIGLKLKKRLSIKWIADFRDPWTEIDYFHQLPLTRRSFQKHEKLESDVVSFADKVLVIGKSMKNKFLKYNANIAIVPNGFDDIPSSIKVNLDQEFSIVHIGLMNSDRNPHSLWLALQELINEEHGFKKHLKIKLIGTISKEVNESLHVFDKHNLHMISYLSHDDVRKHQLSSQVLLLSINKVPASKSIVTGKIFEYLHANRPILAIGPIDGDAAEILKNTNSGVCFDFDDKDAIKNHILALYKQYKKGKLNVDSSHIEQYHRKQISESLANLLKGKATT